MPPSREELAAAQSRPDVELLDVLATELFEGGLQALPGRDGRQRARRWIDRFTEEHLEALCSSAPVRAVLKDESYDKLEDAAAVAAALAEIAGLQGGSLVAAATIISRRGLKAICSQH